MTQMIGYEYRLQFIPEDTCYLYFDDLKGTPTSFNESAKIGKNGDFVDGIIACSEIYGVYPNQIHRLAVKLTRASGNINNDWLFQKIGAVYVISMAEDKWMKFAARLRCID